MSSRAVRLLITSGLLCFSTEAEALLRQHQSASSQVSAKAVTGGSDPINSVMLQRPADADTSKRYLVASFPNQQQVAYAHLPDDVWRPLVIGNVSRPQEVALDGQHMKLYVSDPPNFVIWSYGLLARPDGLLATAGQRMAVVEGFIVGDMSVNGQGDLYFTGYPQGASPSQAFNSIYRQDAANLATGNSMHPTLLYSRSNTGSPQPKAWQPLGLAVDATNLFWGNMADGTTYGSVIRATQGTDGSSQMALLPLSMALNKVTSLAITGTHVFWLAPEGVYGMPQSTSSTVKNPTSGLAASPPGRSSWDPQSIAWDGENTLYMADRANGVIFSLPSLSDRTHNLTKFADVPGISSLAVMNQYVQNSGATYHLTLSVMALFSSLWLFIM